MKDSKNKKLITKIWLSIDSELIKKVDELCKIQLRNRSNLAHRALLEYVNNYLPEDAKKAEDNS